MIVKGIVLKEHKETYKGKNGDVVVRNIKVRESYKNGDEAHVYVKVFGDNSIKAEVGKPIEAECMLSERSGKDGKKYTSLVLVA